MGSRISQSEFLQQAKETHPSYDFSKAVYINVDTKLTVCCPIHGDFEITPYHLIKRKQGCPRCKPHKIIQEDFLLRCKKILPQYDYSKAKYINAHEKVCIICKKHGEFYKFPPELYKGSGCPKCWEERISSKRKRLMRKCEKCGYEWLSVINEENSKEKTICPVCSNKVLKEGYNDLATVHPEILAEWDYNKNGNLLPNMVTSSSTKDIWWKCEKQHSYQQKVKNKLAQNSKCPVCSYRIIIKGINDLETVFPEILNEWDYKKNTEIMPSTISPKSTKKVWWICKNKHSWNASIYERVYHGKTGCPFCRGRGLIQGVNDLKTVNPALAKELHPTKNGIITPSTISVRTSKKVWWICPLGHEYDASVDKRMAGQGCPYCANKRIIIGFNDLYTKRPEIAKEWDYEKNEGLTPKDVVPGSNKKVWWICFVCGNSFQAIIADRTVRNNGCPVCAKQKRVNTRIKKLTQNNSLDDDKDLIKDWDYEANYPKTPKDYTPRSNASVYWKCHICNYQLKSTILNKSRKNGCPACSNRVVIAGRNDLATTNPELAKEWHPTKNGDLTPSQVSRGSGKMVWWLCPMGHEYQATVLTRKGGHGTGCPICYNRRQTSFAEQAVFYYIKKIFPTAINGYKAHFLGKMELDIYIPSIKWAIEYDGKAWHKDDTIERERRKYEICRKHGIRLYRLKEEKQTDKEFGTYDKALNTDGMWTPEKLNQTIYYLLLDLCHNPFIITFDIDVERDRFAIQENMQVKIEDSIATKYPLVAQEWDYDKNGTLKPEMVSHGMHMKVWWKCSKCGNNFQAAISHRCNGTGCPKCGMKKSREVRMKKVACISLETGEVIKIYNSATEACNELKMESIGNVISVCKGNRPNAGGFSWRYVD